MTKAAVKNERRVLLAAIHIKAKSIGISGDDRRALQQNLTGVASCADMTIGQLKSVRDALNLRSSRPAYHEYNDARARKVSAMWGQLCKAGVVRNPKGLDSFVQRQVQIGHLAWVRDNAAFDALFTALRALADRNGVKLNERRS